MQSATTDFQGPVAGSDRPLLVAGAIGPAVIIASTVIAMLFNPKGASLHASELALGGAGWVMSLAFIAVGGCIGAFALGLYRVLEPGSRVGTGLLGVVALALVVSGIFATDAPGAPQTTHGQIHNMAFLVTMLGLILSVPFNALKLRKHGWRHGFGIYSIATVAALPLLVAVFVTVGSEPGDPLYAISGLLLM
ncbi:MAG: DUF998 domain-containing protein, partial [Candidatus Dormibacteraeota bacterium]|nr:DUF998 domain-containing protein [Candidatus Dormibacteraeota bacterium]